VTNASAASAIPGGGNQHPPIDVGLNNRRGQYAILARCRSRTGSLRPPHRADALSWTSRPVDKLPGILAGLVSDADPVRNTPRACWTCTTGSACWTPARAGGKTAHILECAQWRWCGGQDEERLQRVAENLQRLSVRRLVSRCRRAGCMVDASRSTGYSPTCLLRQRRVRQPSTSVAAPQRGYRGLRGATAGDLGRCGGCCADGKLLYAPARCSVRRTTGRRGFPGAAADARRLPITC